MLPSKKNQWLVLAILVMGAIALLSRWPGPSSQTYGQSALISSPNLIFPTIRIVHLDDSVFRFDTTSGELLRFNGNLTGAAANGIWQRFAGPVNRQTSGFLNLRLSGGGIFLIDLETGDTWLLRRAGKIANWIHLQTP